MSRRPFGFVRQSLLGTAVAGLVLWPAMPALGNPAGATVVHGAVDFQAIGNELTVTNTPGAIIDWQSFSIAQDELTRFQQQSAASAVLNRVTGGELSEIMGQLVSNGQVFLVNPNGVVFGQNVTLDTAGFVASTLDLANEDFLSGNYTFEGDGGRIVNEGYLTTRGGNVFFVAADIENSGIIHTEDGSLVLAAGERVRITSLDTPDIDFEVAAPEHEIVNLGAILADQGAVRAFAGTLTHSGEIRANTVSLAEDGSVILSAVGDVTLDDASVVDVSGDAGGDLQIEAGGTLLSTGAITAEGTDGAGGRVRLLADQVGLLGDASITADGTAGGGQVLVGGNRLGQGPEPNATAAFVGTDATITASATDAGAGGEIIVFSEDVTRVYGDLAATGGANGGDGGFIETSGGYIEVTSTPDASAVDGAPGQWLIDPDLLVIGAGGLVEVTELTAGIFVADNAATGPTIQDTVLETAVNAGTSVAVVTAADDDTMGIQINEPLDFVSNTPGVSVDFDASNGGTGAGSITINAAITNTGTDPLFYGFILGDSSPGAVEFNANVDAGVGGVITVSDLGATGTTVAAFGDAAGSTITGQFVADVVDVTNGTNVFNDGLSAGALMVNGGTAQIDATSNVGDLSITTGLLTGTSDIAVTNSFLWGGSANISGSGLIQLLPSIATAQINGTASRVISGDRAIRIENGALLSWNEGTVFFDDTSRIENAGAFQIALAANAALDFNTGTPSFENEGTGTVTDLSSTGVVATIDIPINNAGSVSATGTGAELHLRRGGTSTGTFDATTGGSLRFSGLGADAHTLNGALSSTGGTLIFSGGTATPNVINGAVTATNVTIDGGTHQFETTSSFGSLSMLGGTLAGGATVDVDGAFSWDAGDLSGTGTLQMLTGASGTIDTTGAKNLFGARVIQIDSGATLGWNNGTVFMNDTSRFNVDGAFQANLATANAIDFNAGTPSFDISASGTLTNSSSAVATIDVPINNAGAVSASGGGSELHLRRGGTSSGTFDATAGSSIRFSGLSADAHTLNGALSSTGGTLIFSGGTAIPTIINGTVTATGVDIDGGTHFFDAATSIGSLNLLGGTLTGAGAVDISGTFTWDAGDLDGTSTLTLQSGAFGSIQTTGAKNILGSRVIQIDDSATLDWTEGNVFMNDTSRINVDGTFSANLATARTFDLNGGGTPSIDITSMGNFSNAGSATATFDVTFNNSGNVLADGPDLFLSRGGNSTGDFSISTGNSIRLDGTHALSGSVSGMGGALFQGGTTTLTGSYALTDTTITGGRADFDIATVDTDNLTQSGGFLGGSGEVRVFANLDWSAGTMDGTGTTLLQTGGAGAGTWSTASSRTLAGSRIFQIGSGRTLNWNSGTTFVLGNAEIRNAGTFDQTLDGDFAIDVSGAGTQRFVNEAGGVFRNTNARTATLDLAFDNAGTVQSDAGELFLARGGISTGNFFTAGGTLRFADADSVGHAISGQMSGTTTFIFSGAGTTALSGTNNMDSVLIDTGSVEFNSFATIANLQLSGGNLGGSNTVNVTGGLLWDGAGNMSQSGSVNLAASSTSTITGAAGRVVTDRNLTVENGAVVNWNDGTIFLGGTSTWNQGGTLNLLGNDTLDFNTGNPLFNLQSTGVLNVNVAGTHTFDVNTFLGGTTNITAGTLQLTRGGNHSGVVNSADTLRFGGGIQTLQTNFDFVDTGAGTGELLMSAGEALVVAPASISVDRLRLTGGTWGGLGETVISNSGDFFFEGGFLGRTSDSGRLLIPTGSTAFFQTSGTKTLRGDYAFTNQGTTNWTDGAITLNDTASLENEAALFIDLGGSRTLDFGSNDPDFVQTATGTLTVGSNAASDVTIDVDATLSGNVFVDGGSLTFTRGGNYDAAITTAAGQFTRFGGSTIHNWNTGLSFTDTGFVEIPSGTTVANAAVTANHLRLNGGTLGGNGAVDVSTTFIFESGTFGRVGDFGILTLNAGGSGSFDTSAAKVLRGDGALVNEGTLTWNDGNITLIDTVALENRATFNVALTGARTLDLGGGTPIFISSGTLAKSADASVTTIDVVSNLSNTVTIGDGTLAFTAPSTQNAAYTLTAATSELRFSSDTHDLFAPMSVTGAGFTNVQGGTLQLSAGETVGFDELRLNGGFLGGLGTYSVADTLLWNSGGLVADAVLDLNPTASGSFASSAAKTLAGNSRLEINGGMSWLDGNITMSDTSVIQNNGAFTIDLAANRTLDLGSGTPLFFSQTGNVVKQGTTTATIDVVVDIDGGLTINDGTLSLTEGGAIGSAATINGPGLLINTSNTLTLDDGADFAGTGFFEVGGGQVRVLDGSSVTFDNLRVSGGEFSGDGASVVDGQFEWNGGFLGSATDLGGNRGSLALSMTSTNTIGTTAAKTQRGDFDLSNDGGLTWTGGNITLLDTASLLNSGTFTINSANVLDLGGGTPSFLTTAASSIVKADAGTTTIDVPTTLEGTLTTPGGGTVALTEGSTIRAAVTLSANGRLELAAGPEHLLTTGADFAGPGDLAITGGLTRVDAAITTEADFLTITGGVLAGPGSLNVSSAMTWNGGQIGDSTFGGAVTLLTGGSLDIDTSSAKTLRNASLVTQAGTTTTWTDGNITLFEGATITNQGAFDFDADRTLDTGDGSNPFFQNDGAIVKDTATGTTTIDVLLDNDGTMTASAGIISLNRDGTHDGTFNSTSPGEIRFDNGVHVIGAGGGFFTDADQLFDAQTLTFDGGFGGGTVTIQNGSDITFNGAYNATDTVVDSSTATFNGTSGSTDLSVTNGTLAGSGTLTVTNNIALNNATLAQSGAFEFWTVSNVTGTGFTQTGSGSSAFNGALNVGAVDLQAGTVTIGGASMSTGTLDLTGGTLTVDGLLDVQTNFTQSGGVVNGTGELGIVTAGTLSGGSQSGFGDTILRGGATLDVDGDHSLFEERILFVDGVATLTTGTGDITLFDNANLRVRSGGELRLTSFSSIRDGANNTGFTEGSFLEIVGTLDKSGSNTSVLDLENLTISGTVDVAAGSGLTLQGPSVTDGGVFENAGTVSYAGGVLHGLTGASALNGAGTYQITDGQFGSAFGTTNTVTNLQINGSGGVLNEGTLEITGSLNWLNGFIASTPSGLAVLAPTATGTIQGVSTKFLGGNLDLVGNTTWSAGNIEFSSGAMLQVSGTTTATHGGNAFTLGTTFPGSTIDGNETFRVAPTGTFVQNGVNTLAVAPTLLLQSGGTVRASTGTVSFDGGGSSAGTFAVNGGDVRIGGGVLTLDSGAEVTGSVGFLRVAGGTVGTVSGVTVDATRVAVDSGVLGGAGTLNVSNRFEWQGGTIGGESSTVDVLGSATGNILGATSRTLDAGTLRIGSSSANEVLWSNGNITAQNGGVLEVAGNLRITNGGNALLDATPGAGTERVSITASGVLTRDGANTADLGTLVDNGGTIATLAGGLNLSGGGTSTGAFDTAAGGTLRFSGGTQTLDGATGSGTGGFNRVAGGTVVIANTTPSSIDRFAVDSGVLRSEGLLTINDAFDWDGGTIGGGAGVVEVAASATGTIDQSTTRTLDSGTLRLNSAGANFVDWSNGNITAQNGARLEIGGNLRITNGGNALTDGSPGVGTEAIDITSTGVLTRDGANDAALATPVNNAGTIFTFNGGLQLSGGGTSTGAFDTATGGTLRFAGGTHLLDGVTGLGTDGFNRVSGGTVLFQGAASSLDRFAVDGGQVAGASALLVGNRFEWSGGVIGGNGGTVTVAAGADGSIFGGATKGLGTGTLRIDSAGGNSVSWSNGNISFDGDALLEIGGTLRATNGGNALLDATAGTGAETVRILETGLLERDGANEVVLEPILQNDGRTLMTSGLLRATGGGTHTGVFSASAGQFRFGGGVHVLTAGLDGEVVIDGTGTHAVSSGALIVDGSTTLNATRLGLENGSLIVDGAANVTDAFSWSAGNLEGIGALTVTSTAGGDITGGAARTIDGGTLRVLSDAANPLSWSNGNITLDNGGRIEVGGRLDITNGGNALLLGATPGLASLNVLSGGTLRRNGANTVVVSPPATLDGDVVVDSGGLTFAGATTIGATSTITANNNTLSFAGGGVANGSTFVVNLPGVLSFDSVFTLNNPILLGDGTLSGTPTINSALTTIDSPMTFSDADITTTGTLLVNDLLTLEGTVNVDGDVTNGMTGTILVQGTAAFGDATANLPSLNNLGSVVLTNTATGTSATLNVAGTFTSTGSIQLLDGLGGGVRTLRGALDVQGGTFDLFTGTTSASILDVRGAGPTFLRGGSVNRVASDTTVSILVDDGAPFFGLSGGASLEIGSGSTVTLVDSSTSVEPTFTFEDATLTGLGTLDATQVAFELAGMTTRIDGATLNVASATLFGGDALDIRSGGTLGVSGLTRIAGGDVTLLDGGTIQLGGALELDGGDGETARLIVTNSSIALPFGGFADEANLSADVTSTVSFTGGNFDFRNAVNLDGLGLYDASGAGTLSVSPAAVGPRLGGRLVLNGDVVGGTGVFNVTGGGTLEVRGTTSFGGTLNVTGTLSLPSDATPADFSVAQLNVNGGTIDLFEESTGPSGSLLNVTGGPLVLSGGDIVANGLGFNGHAITAQGGFQSVGTGNQINIGFTGLEIDTVNADITLSGLAVGTGMSTLDFRTTGAFALGDGSSFSINDTNATILSSSAVIADTSIEVNNSGGTDLTFTAPILSLGAGTAFTLGTDARVVAQGLEANGFNVDFFGGVVDAQSLSVLDGQLFTSAQVSVTGNTSVSGGSAFFANSFDTATLEVSAGLADFQQTTTAMSTNLSGGTLNFQGPSSTNALTIQGGVLGGIGALSVSDTFDWNGGSIFATPGASLTLGSTSTTQIDGLVNAAGIAIRNEGTATIEDGILDLGFQSSFTNAGTLQIRDFDSGIRNLSGGNSFTNETGALIDVDATGPIGPSANGPASTFLEAQTLNLAGTIQVDGGSFALRADGASTHTAATTVGADSELFLVGSHTLESSGSITAPKVQILNTGATSVLDGTFSTPDLTLGGNVDLRTALSLTDLRITSTQDLRFGTVTGTIDNAVGIDVSGDLVWDAGTLTGVGATTTVASTGTLTIPMDTGVALIDHALVHESTTGDSSIGSFQLETNAGASIVNRGVLALTGPSGAFARIGDPSGGVAGSFVNEASGTLNVDPGAFLDENAVPSGGGLYDLNIAFDNAGAVTLNRGFLRMIGPGTHSGSFDLLGSLFEGTLGGARLRTRADTTFTETSSITGVSFGAQGGTTVINGTVAVESLFAQRNATLTLNSDVAAFNLGLVDFDAGPDADADPLPLGRLDGTGNLTVSNLFFWDGGVVGGSGSLTILPTASVELGDRFFGEDPTRFPQLVLDGRTFTNNGAATLEDGTAASQFFRSTLTIQNGGRFEHNGSLRVLDSLGGPSSIVVADAESAFVNAGTIAVVAPGTEDAAQAAFTATGLTMTGGVLDVAAGRTATLTNFVQSAGTVSGGGDVVITGTSSLSGTHGGSGETTLQAGSTTTLGTLAVSGGRAFVSDGTANLGTGPLSIGLGASFTNGGMLELVGATASITGEPGGLFVNEATLSGATTALTLSVDTTQAGTLATQLLDVAAGSTFTSGGGSTAVAEVFGNAGIVTLTPAATVTVGEFVNTGTLQGIGSITGTVTNNGVLAPGNSPGRIDVIGDFVQSADGILQIELDGTGAEAGTDFDLLAVTGNATFDGTLQLVTLENFSGSLGQDFQPITYGSADGSFATVTQPSETTTFDPVFGAEGLQATLSQLDGEVFTPEPEPDPDPTFDPDDPTPPQDPEQARDFAEDLLQTCPEERDETQADNNTAREQQNTGGQQEEGDATPGSQTPAGGQGVGCVTG